MLIEAFCDKQVQPAAVDAAFVSVAGADDGEELGAVGGAVGGRASYSFDITSTPVTSLHEVSLYMC